MTIEINPIPAMVFSVVVPIYYSEKTIQELYHRLTVVMESLHEPYEIIFVEDGGRDASWDRLREIVEQDSRVTAIQLMRNSGQGNATLAGLAAAQGSVIITIDDDLQEPPEELPKMIRALFDDSEVDVVIGAPVSKQHNFIRRLGSRMVNRVNSLMLKKDPNLRLTSFRVIRRQVVDAILELRVPYPALGLMIVTVTHRVINILVSHNQRKAGRSTYNLRRLLKQTLSNFIGYSVLPLHFLALIGGTGIVISFLLAVFYAIRYFVVGIGIAGWTTLLLVLLALSGFNFFAFAILGEYILRVTQISSNTSRWIVRSKITTAAKKPDRIKIEDRV